MRPFYIYFNLAELLPTPAPLASNFLPIRAQPRRDRLREAPSGCRWTSKLNQTFWFHMSASAKHSISAWWRNHTKWLAACSTCSLLGSVKETSCFGKVVRINCHGLLLSLRHEACASKVCKKPSLSAVHAYHGSASVSCSLCDKFFSHLVHGDDDPDMIPGTPPRFQSSAQEHLVEHVLYN